MSQMKFDKNKNTPLFLENKEKDGGKAEFLYLEQPIIESSERPRGSNWESLVDDIYPFDESEEETETTLLTTDKCGFTRSDFHNAAGCAPDHCFPVPKQLNQAETLFPINYFAAGKAELFFSSAPFSRG